MISLVIPPKDQISRVSKMLADEYGTASNIKSRVNRLSVLGAITSTQQRLKLCVMGGGGSALLAGCVCWQECAPRPYPRAEPKLARLPRAWH